MAQTRLPVFTDPSVVPDAARVAQVLGGSVEARQRLTEQLGSLGLEVAWRHYRDGGWLCRALRGSKVVAWLAVWDGYATVTCYFAARHRAGLVELPVPEALRTQAARVEMSGRLLPLVIEIRTNHDADAAAEVVRFKLACR